MAPTPTPCARHGFISRRRIGEGGWRKGVDVWDFVDSETKKRRACTPHPRQPERRLAGAERPGCGSLDVCEFRGVFGKTTKRGIEETRNRRNDELARRTAPRTFSVSLSADRLEPIEDEGGGSGYNEPKKLTFEAAPSSFLLFLEPSTQRNPPPRRPPKPPAPPPGSPPSPRRSRGWPSRRSRDRGR